MAKDKQEAQQVETVTVDLRDATKRYVFAKDTVFVAEARTSHLNEDLKRAKIDTATFNVKVDLSGQDVHDIAGSIASDKTIEFVNGARAKANKDQLTSAQYKELMDGKTHTVPLATKTGSRLRLSDFDKAARAAGQVTDASEVERLIAMLQAKLQAK